eukprot:4643515-Pyramimonas_sp.AAC.1
MRELRKLRLWWRATEEICHGHCEQLTYRSISSTLSPQRSTIAGGAAGGFQQRARPPLHSAFRRDSTNTSTATSCATWIA